MLNRNLIVLFFCQLIAATGAITLVTLGGIIGAQLASNPAFATLPASLWVLATAASTIPAALLMRRIGRPLGFCLSALSACAGLLIAVAALRYESFFGFLFAAAVFGINMAFAQQYRFAAIESTAKRFAGRAVSFVLIGAVGGAFLGPLILQLTADAEALTRFERPLLVLASLYFVCAIATLLLRSTDQGDDTTDQPPGRPLSTIVRQPAFIVAVLSGASGYGVMVFVMTATPLSMHVIDGFTLEQTASVIRAHVLGMYLPSFVSGLLIDRLGVTRMLAIGALMLLTALSVGTAGHELGHYWTALIFLGVGWNFMFVGGTTMLTRTYTRDERFGAQAVNDFIVFGTTAAGSLLAGTIMYAFGWFTTVVAPIPVLVIVLVALYLVRRDPLVARPQAG